MIYKATGWNRTAIPPKRNSIKKYRTFFLLTNITRKYKDKLPIHKAANPFMLPDAPTAAPIVGKLKKRKVIISDNRLFELIRLNVKNKKTAETIIKKIKA
ncbi:MAG: hypothetical protein QW471_03980 [Candidatus Woesearchaeota archaeon]